MSAAKLCRMCGEMTDSGVSLLDPANRHIADIAQCIVSNFKYEISSNSKFPHHICDVCAEEVQDWMYFLERCKKSQTHFSTVVAAENLKNAEIPLSEIKQDPDGPSQVCPHEDPLLSASELEIAAKFPELKLASVPVVRLDQMDIEKYQQPIRILRNEAKLYEDTQVDRYPKYSCQLCDKKIMRLANFKLHLTKTHHLSKEEVFKYVPEFYECKYCHRQFKKPSRLHVHEGSHTLPFKCNICDKRFGREGDLKIHKLTHSEPQLPCPHCDMKFRHKSHLKCHIETQHSRGVRKYKCHHCEKLFKMRSYLSRHIRNIHSAQNGKIWKCDECGKCFKLKRYLKRHYKYSHVVDVKFNCAHCDKIFKQKYELTRHTERKHKME